MKRRVKPSKTKTKKKTTPKSSNGFRSGDQKRAECLELSDQYKRMEAIAESMAKIREKCELFMADFGIGSADDDNESQLNAFKHVLNELRPDFGRQWQVIDADDNRPVDGQRVRKSGRKRPVVLKEEEESAVESDYSGASGGGSPQSVGARDDDDDDEVEYNDKSVVHWQRPTVEDLDAKIEVFYETDDRSGKREKRFRCPSDGCDLVSHSRANIVAHLVKHTDDRDFQCFWPNCEKSFPYKKSLIGHIESFHLRKERFKCCCSGCGRVFAAKSGLHMHLKNDHSLDVSHDCAWIECQMENLTHTCRWPNCALQFDNNKLLESHMEETHLSSPLIRSTNEESVDSPQSSSAEAQQQKRFKCAQKGCAFEANSKKSLDEHRSKHKSRYLAINRRNQEVEEDKEENYINKYTGKLLSRRRRDRNHPCTWPACELTFESPGAVKIHMRKHTGEKPFVCDWAECGKSFRYTGALKLHKEMIHLQLKQFKCDWPECDEAFVSQCQLNVHKAQHTGVKKYECDWPGCEWRTNHYQQLAIHRARRHEGVKLRLKRYKSKNNSNPNSEYDFKGELKKFRCDWPGCERRFRFENNLEQHLRTHERSDPESAEKKERKQRKPRESRKGEKSEQIKEKTFVCEWPECNSKYTSKTMLSQHMNKHTGLKPFVCEQCNQSFSYSKSLRTHIQMNHQTDGPDLPFKCHYFRCNRSFDKNKSLNVHIRRVHEKRNNTANNDQLYDRHHLSGPDLNSLINNQTNVIRLERIKAFNAMRIQPQTPIQLNPNYAFQSAAAHRPARQCPTPGSPSSPAVATAKRLLTNALRKQHSIQQNVQNLSQNSFDGESIAKELPHPCTREGCWRRFKSEKALEWHLKKYH